MVYRCFTKTTVSFEETVAVVLHETVTLRYVFEHAGYECNI